MRNILMAGLALMTIGVTDGFAAEADTTRAGAVLPGAPSALQAPDDLQEIQDGYPQDRYDRDRDSQDRYDRYDQDRYGYRPDVRVWLDSRDDVFRPGERTRVRMRVEDDAYVAVLNIDPRGDVEVLWPRSYYDDGYVEGGRTVWLSSHGSQYLNVGGSHGIGYVFAVASSEPIDTRSLRDYYGRRTVGWDRRYNVYGDPFYAMERFERMLVYDYEYGDHSTDYASYHVGSRYRYPRYACYTSYGSWYTSVGVYTSDCDYVRVVLRERPYYYDTRYWRGDRGYYYRRHYRGYYDDRDFRDYYARRRVPEHRYKDGTGGRSAEGSTSVGRPSRPSTRTALGSAPPSRTGSDDYQEQEPRAKAPTRQRPTLQRRPTEGESPRGDGERRAEPRDRDREPRQRDEPRQREETRREPPRERSEPRAEPRREPPRQRDEPRAEPRSQPRNDPPPSRGSGERSTSSERPSPRVRP